MGAEVRVRVGVEARERAGVRVRRARADGQSQVQDCGLRIVG